MRFDNHTPTGHYMDDWGEAPFNPSDPFPNDNQWPAASLLFATWYYEYKMIDDKWAACFVELGKRCPAVFE